MVTNLTSRTIMIFSTIIIVLEIFFTRFAISSVSPALGIIDSSNSVTNEKFFEKWTHEMDLDSGMRVKWNSDDPYYLTMEISAPTRGYVGVGFSRNGGMTGADIVLGWVTAEGIPMIKDYHGIENGHPIEDFQQDYDLIAGTEREDGTTILFRRRWDTCDEHDMAIQEDTMRLIWAWQANDPQLFPRLIFPWHGQSNRGVKSVFMRNPSMSTKRFPDVDPNSPENKNTKTWDVAVNNIRIERTTTYMCKLVKFPARQGPKHIIGFKPLVDSRNREHVHHMTLYHCFVPPHFGRASTILERYIGQPEEDCFQTNAEYNLYCMAFAFTWGIGSEGEMFPQHVGIPLGDYTEEPSYFKFEIHYDNPSRRTFNDNSGIRVFYTDNLRQFDAGTLFLGHRVTPFHLIPGAQPSFTTYSICSNECTQNGIKLDSGIKAMSVLLHAHEIGKKIKLRHIRNGVELEPIAADNHFDFNYQQFRTLKNEPTILPGDDLMVECTYDTMTRNRMTYGGSSFRHEMCQVIMLYYPKTKISDCRSQPEFTSFFDALKIQNVSGKLLDMLGMPLTNFDDVMPPDDVFTLESSREEHFVNAPFDQLEIMKPIHLQNQNLGQHIREMNWNDTEFVSQVEQSWRNGNHYMFCMSPSTKIANYNMITKIPKFHPYAFDERPACRFQPGFGYPENAAKKIITNEIHFCLGLLFMTHSVFIMLLF